jgi:hypothetical protein
VRLNKLYGYNTEQKTNHKDGQPGKKVKKLNFMFSQLMRWLFLNGLKSFICQLNLSFKLALAVVNKVMANYKKQLFAQSDKIEGLNQQPDNGVNKPHSLHWKLSGDFYFRSIKKAALRLPMSV